MSRWDSEENEMVWALVAVTLVSIAFSVIGGSYV